MESKIIQEEFLDYVNAGFTPVLTEDGSYSLRQGDKAEPMHSLKGALKESLFVYGEALELFLKKNQDLEGEGVEVISLGLGFGYNEVITAFKLSHSKKYQLLSYESEKILENLFTKRLLNPEAYPLYWKPFNSNNINDVTEYQNVLSKVLVHSGPLSKKVVEGWNEKTRLVLFDAYSSKTTEILWTKEFLELLLSKCKNGSVFSTYAAKGVLNRALKNYGFENLKKEGFGSKRQSTLAVKN